MNDSYFTIKTEGEGLYKEKGSKFLAFAYPVKTLEEIKDILDRFRKEYHNARHICYAYKIGYDEQAAYRMNDDGEPSGTAGKPIYGQILSQELTDVLIVVVRYFGGTKLGVSGLINAYKTAAYEAINAAERIRQIRTQSLMVSYDFSLTNEAMRIVKDYQLNIKAQDYDTACHLKLEVRLSDYKRVRNAFEKVYGIQVD